MSQGRLQLIFLQSGWLCSVYRIRHSDLVVGSTCFNVGYGKKGQVDELLLVSFAQGLRLLWAKSLAGILPKTFSLLPPPPSRKIWQ